DVGLHLKILRRSLQTGISHVETLAQVCCENSALKAILGQLGSVLKMAADELQNSVTVPQIYGVWRFLQFNTVNSFSSSHLKFSASLSSARDYALGLQLTLLPVHNLLHQLWHCSALLMSEMNTSEKISATAKDCLNVLRIVAEEKSDYSKLLQRA